MSSNQQPHSVSVLALAIASIATCVAATALSWFVGTNLGWAQPASSAILGGFTTLIASCCAIFVVRIMIGMRQQIAIAAVAAGIVRTLCGLFIALGVYFTANPEGRTFWSAFLISNLLALIAESIWGIKNNARESASASQSVGVRE